MTQSETLTLPGPLAAAYWIASFRFGFKLMCLLALTMTVARADDTAVVQAVLADLATQSSSAEKESLTAIQGTDGWLFFAPELRALSVGPFWGVNAARVSRSTKPEYADPLPAIVDFHDQLNRAGIELLVMPVPAKAAVYPEVISTAIPKSSGTPQIRIDQSHQEFYALLKQQGITVIDLLPLFLKHRAETGGPLYCKTDSHWSGRGVAVAADAVYEIAKDRTWLKEAPKTATLTAVRDVQFAGDLARMLNEQNPQRETLPFTFIGTGNELSPIAPQRDSPILLIGDSHTLIFHDATLVTSGAGLPDQLTQRLRVPVDLIGVRGSGATTTRIELLRRKDNLQGKKLVIWCFSIREFTESPTGWRKVPVIR